MIINLNELQNTLRQRFDVFIASASYENRCLSIMNAISESNDFSFRFVAQSIPHKDLIQKNLEKFINNGFDLIEVNNTQQIDTAMNFITHFNKVLQVNPEATFLIDITTFTKQTLLIMLRILREILTKKNQILFLYTPAKEYSTGLPYDKKWLSRGILNVNSILGYSGIIKPSNSYHLIILMGFEVERASALINAYEPSKISIGYASKESSTSVEHYKINRIKFDQLLAEFPFAQPFEFSGTAVTNCKLDILKQIEKHTNYNVVVSPMNNKISALSCALAAFDNETIQLAIAIPVIYNHENYSEPSNICYIIEIPDFIKDHSIFNT